MAKKQIRVKCSGTPPDEHWTVDPTGTDVTPLVKELQKYRDFCEVLPVMGKPDGIKIEVDDQGV